MKLDAVVVTGAVKPGLGEAITRRLLQDGFAVLGTYEAEDAQRAEALLAEVASNERLSLSLTDHSNRRSLMDFINGISSPIQGLIHAQFFFGMENPEDFDHDLWDRSLAVNLTAPNFLTHGLKHHLVTGGSVIMVTSTEGFTGSFGATAYAATKAAMHNLVKSLANNLGRRGIRVNAVAAGWIGGVMDTDEVFSLSRRITPLERLGHPEEVAAVTRFLLSDESGFINGSVITADGGYTGVDTIAKHEFNQSRLPGGA